MINRAASHEGLTRRGRIGCLVAICLVPLCACTPGSDLPPLPIPPSTAFRLGSGDVVRIITYGEQSLTGEFRVGGDGDIAMPLLGDVHAAGLTPAGLSDAVALALKARHLLRDPSVSVEVAAYRPVFILGEVAKPGQYPYQPGMSVLTAVAVAGGFTYRAVESYAAITRSPADGGVAVEGKVERSTRVEPGDVITVFERRF